MEYFIVLFSIRYEKHWRTAKPPVSLQSQLAHPVLPSSSNVKAQTDEMVCSPFISSSLSFTRIHFQKKKNGLEQAARAFSTMNKITPETRVKFSTMVAKRREEALINEANCIPAPTPTHPIIANRKR